MIHPVRPWRLAPIGAGVAAALTVGAATGWAREGDRVMTVDVSGTKTIAKETILAKVQTKPGSPYQDAVVSEDIRRVFALGYFTDVKADVEPVAGGVQLTFVVKEKPTITAVVFEGQRFLRQPKVQELLGIAEGALHDPRLVKEGIDRLKAEYGRKGFAQCEVVSRVEQDTAANTAALYLLIDEGPRMRVIEVLVEGNQIFPDRRIRKLMKTKRKRWFQPGVYQEAVLDEDLDRVGAFYRQHGYEDVAVSKEVLRDPSGRGLYVSLRVQEGLQHRVGQVALAGVSLFPEPELRRVLALKPGAVYSPDGLQEDLRRIKEYYGDRGYINAEVSPDPQLDQETKRVNLTYRVVEHELVHINRIAIRGNLRTKDVVVRRELRVYPGDPFDGAKIRKSTDRLYNLGFFEEVNVETEPTEDPHKEDLIVDVKEAKTGSFSFGGGFSSIDRLVGLVELEQRNFDWRNVPTFTGAGQDLRLRVEGGTVRRYFDLSFTEPWIFGHPVSFGIDLYNRTRLQSRSLGLAFEEERRGAGVRLGKEFADKIQTSLAYQFFQTEISDVVTEASADLRAEQGTSNTSEGSLSVALDTRNNRFDPTRGTHVFTATDLAGGVFGGDEDFYRLQGGASYYWPHAGRLVLEAHVRTGIVDAYGDATEVPIFERFFGGGSGTIRGYEERNVGPRDPSSSDPIGGEALAVGTLEEVVTIVRDERGRSILKGSLFYDVGDVWRRVKDYGESVKSGVGVGMRVTTPIGPLRLDVGFPLDEVGGEERKPRFHFNISRGF